MNELLSLQRAHILKENTTPPISIQVEISLHTQHNLNLGYCYWMLARADRSFWSHLAYRGVAVYIKPIGFSQSIVIQGLHTRRVATSPNIENGESELQ